MGLLSKKEAGHRCEVDEQGITHCQIFDATDKEGKLSSGTDFAFQVTRENNCEAIMVGGHDILEKDESKVQRIIGDRVRACRRGLG